MIYTIKNDILSVDVNSKGAELWSIKKDGTEYLWQGDATYWTNRATTLFPYIARLNDGKYTLDGKEYSMQIHGFAKLMDFSVKSHTESEIVIGFDANEETLAQYPFLFSFSMTFSLEGDTIITKYTVENSDDKTMYFGVGGHTGFNVPMDDGLEFTDYVLEFSEENEPTKVIFDEKCLVTGEMEPIGFSKTLKLRHDLFDADAILMTDMPKTVAIKSEKGEKSVIVSYPQMPYLAVWHKPKMEAPYVCIEPWSSTPSRADRIEDLSKQENLVSLEAKGTYENTWTITIK
ncbi:MAG: aldose 1-epimerase family protein [Clostridia bacterium]